MNTKSMPLSEIIVPESFREHSPSSYKIRRAYAAFVREGKQTRPIIVNRDGLLLRGYITLLICRLFNLSTVQVEVQESTTEEDSQA